jgi:serine/threonine protein kinase
MSKEALQALAPEEFAGSERFALQHRLGAGAFGIVYQAFDRERKQIVALKVLRDAGADALYRFKREFRSLAGLAHPNLVSLHELLSEGGRWFFTMELVRGVSFLEHVWAGDEHGQGLLYQHTDSMTAPTSRFSEAPTLRAGRAGPPSRTAIPAPSSVPANLDRLRATLRQLAAGLEALHGAGKLHRDLKPSNVLVSREGRVVILDFGLVADIDPHLLESGTVVGTPAYMSPEQGGGAAVTEASDWYAVGTMLYQALTGHVPFSGPFLDVLMSKRSAEPPPPAEVVANVPKDLDSLCRDLLRIEPDRRPRGPEILRRLGGAPLGAPAAEPAPAPAARPPLLVGRGRHLDLLRGAFQAAKEGRAVTVLIKGPSGMGKTALVRHFLEEARAEDAVVLAGRCYEQESVPYKALDSAVDALSRFLKRLDNRDVEALLPRDILALGRLFPVLRQVAAVAAGRRRLLDVPDPQELRRRAFSALRELLWRLAARRNLVVAIDDLHWGDADSAALLADLVRPPDPPPMLLLGCYRSEEAQASPLLRALLPGLSSLGDVREVAVAELSPEEARELAERLLEASDGGARSRAEAIARESAGNPFFIDELARYESAAPAGARGVAGARRETTLAEVIHARVAQLPGEARRLLEILAVAGQPVERAVALAAAGLESQGPSAVDALRSAHLVRTGGTRERDQIETYHDRIRETIAAAVPKDALPELHHRLAAALEASGRPDPETLAVHLAGAGDAARAARYAAEAADHAVDALAFDRAARLYRFALDLVPDPTPDRLARQVKLGDALANAGRGAEAAAAYRVAAEEASGAFALELRRRIAEQFLISGHIDEGVEALGEVFRLLGMRLPATPRRALASLLLRRALIRLRGLGFEERDAATLPPEQLIRIDTCWSVTAGLTFVDTIRGGEFQARHLLLALRAGEPYRVARALALEAGHAALGGGRTQARTQRMVARLRAIADRVRHPHALALAALAEGVAAYLEGSFHAALETLDRAEAMMREGCTGVTWEKDNAQLYALRSLWFLGELREMSRRLPAFLKDMEKRGDRYGATHVARVSYLARLIEDAPAEAIRELDEAIERWSLRGFLLQHFWDLIGRVETGLYEGEAERAGKLIAQGWPRVRRSLLLRIQFGLISALDVRARCALARAAAVPPGREAEALLAAALADASRIERERMSWAAPLAVLVRAGAASLRGETQAVALLAAAEEAAVQARLGLHAAVARHRRGLLTGDRVLVDGAEAWMASQGVRNPPRLAGMLCPGPWRA